jgi:predicted metal-dependent hydrolase
VKAPDRLTVLDRELRMELVESSRRRTLGIEVHPHPLEGARLVVRIPAGMPWSELEPRLARRAGWIARQAASLDRYLPAPQPRQYLAGETFRLLGRQLQLKLSTGRHGVTLQGSQLQVQVPQPKDRASVSAVLARWYHTQAQVEFGRRLEKCLHDPLLQPAPAVRLQVRRLQRRWGSLSAKGTLTLNTKLVERPARCIDYVIAHELCHHWFPDHGQDFFKLLGDVMPNWMRRKEELEAVAS